MTPLLSSALLATQSDERLLTLAVAGHDRAFEAIVERYRRPLARYLRRLLSAPLAEDVLQATFLNAWRSLERGTQVRELRPWLYRIAHNQAVNALERAEPRLAAADAESLATVAGPEAEVEQRDALARALSAIAGLPDRQRAALVAVAVEDRPHPDVARELGLTEGALRQLVHRARTTLRAAATAVVPFPLVSIAVAGGSDQTVSRVAEVAAGAGGAGLGVKTGAALLAAGALVVGAPAVHEQRAHQGGPLRAEAATAAHAAPASRASRAVLPAPAPAAQPRLAGALTGHGRRARRGDRVSSHRGHGSSGRAPLLTSGRDGSGERDGTRDRSGEGARHGSTGGDGSDPSADDGDGQNADGLHRDGSRGGDGRRSGAKTPTTASGDDGDRHEAAAQPTTTDTTEHAPEPADEPSGGGGGGTVATTPTADVATTTTPVPPGTSTTPLP